MSGAARWREIAAVGIDGRRRLLDFAPMQPLRIGDHIRARRFGYWHDAIYVGDDHVIHVWCEGLDKSLGRVRRDPVHLFAANSKHFEVVPYTWCFEPFEVVRRAQSRSGQGKYDLLRSNCQHFARWCKTNESISDGVDRAVAITAGASATHVASKAALAATTGAIGRGSAWCRGSDVWPRGRHRKRC